jgi:hypothetical protein
MGVEDWTALTLRPLVLGPDNVPMITNPADAARDLALATFSAMTHGRDPDPTAILEALATALGSSDGQSVSYYSEMLEIGLGDSPARDTWRNVMSRVPPFGTYFPGRGTLIEESYLEGKAEGKAEAGAASILRVLERRGIPVPDHIRDRITTCTHLDTLNTWLDQAITISTASDLFTADTIADAENPVRRDSDSHQEV